MATKRLPETARGNDVIPFKDLAEAYTAQVETRREAIAKGNGDVLLAAIMDVVLGRIPFPEWLSYEVAAAIRRYTHHEVQTLDDAFRVKRPKGYRRAATRRRWTKSMLVVNDIFDLNRAGYPIDGDLFEAVGGINKEGKTTISKWYAYHKKNNTVTFLVAKNLNAKSKKLPKRLEEAAKSLTKSEKAGSRRRHYVRSQKQ